MQIIDSDDEYIHKSLLIIGKRVFISSMELDEFINVNMEEAIKRDKTHPSNDKEGSERLGPEIKYWMALSSRADIVAEKVLNHFFHYFLIPIRFTFQNMLKMFMCLAFIVAEFTPSKYLCPTHQSNFRKKCRRAENARSCYAIIEQQTFL